MDGAAAGVDWHLTALDNHGPEIPCTPAVVLVKKLLRDEILDRGAAPCLNLFTVDEFMAELSDFSVTASVETH